MQPNKIIKVIPSLDCIDIGMMTEVVSSVADLDLIYGFKIGLALGLSFGLPTVVKAIRAITDKPIIYDHQKAGTDIPDTGALFADTLIAAGVDEAILFPQSGPNTLKSWVQACRTRGLKVIVGGLMTHSGYVQSEGGFILDSAIPEIYKSALALGVSSFVVPLTKSAQTFSLFQKAGLTDSCEFYSPGLGAQGGALAGFEFLKIHYLIIGRALLNAPDRQAYIKELEKNFRLASCQL